MTDVFDSLAPGTVAHTMLYDAACAARRHEDGPALTHSWLFTGPPGAGRSTAALAFAASLVCTNDDVVGCGHCDACRAALGGSHPDVTHVVPQELTLRVSEVRDLIKVASTLPTEAPWRVLIIEDADRLRNEGANAFLKTVEEPPARTIIVLCAPSTEDMVETLRSRCRHVYIPTPSVESVARVLMGQGVAQAPAMLAASATNQHIGRARHLATTKQAQVLRAQVLNVAELVYHGDVAFRTVSGLFEAIEAEVAASLEAKEAEEKVKLEQALGMGGKGKGAAKAARGTKGTVDDLEKKQKLRRTRGARDGLDLALGDLAGLYRDALVHKGDAGVGLTHPDFEGLSRELAEKNSEEALLACIDALAQCRADVAANVRPAVALDALVGRLRLACGVR